MTDIAGLPSLTEATADTGSAVTSELGQDAFLSLLTTQLQNQDPLDPMANEEFVAQLATFSSLEQLMAIETGLEAVYLGIASMNNAAMAGLVGKDVVASGNGISYDGSGSVELHYHAENSSASAEVTITDEEGSIVYAGDIGGLSEGEGSWTWDGRDEDGQLVEEGLYTFEIEATDSEGETVEVEERIVGTIDEMDYSTGVPMPSVDGVLVDLAEILALTDGSEDAEEEVDG